MKLDQITVNEATNQSNSSTKEEKKKEKAVKRRIEVDESRMIQLATKGVVQLFNVVTKVQQQQQTNITKTNSDNNNSKNTNGTSSKTVGKKFSFISELKKISTTTAGPSIGAQTHLLENAKLESSEPQSQSQPQARIGWSVLHDDFGTGHSKLKDWDANDSSQKGNKTKKEKLKNKNDTEINDGMIIDFDDEDQDDDDDD